MALRNVVARLWEHGRYLLRTYNRLPVKQLSGPPPRDKILPLRGTNIRTSLGPGGISPVQWHYETARRVFVEGVLKRVTNSLSGDLRKRTTKQLLFGNARPFFALVGVSLASGTGIITKEDEMEGICWEIKEAVGRMQESLLKAESDLFEPEEEISLGKFTVGPPIAKGTNGVVYAARKNAHNSDADEGGGSNTIDVREDEPLLRFPFALKMLFNYQAESNALTILRTMHRETIPAKFHYISQNVVDWQTRMFERTIFLPPHPNIVAMHCAFTDWIPSLPGSLELYPQALPTRLNPEGDGRNMSLFLLMKRYDMSLKEYLSKGLPERREGILLFTQLLEAVSHMNRHGVAHRDLKSDNLLLEVTEEECPSLVVTDFGCALADSSHRLNMPYRTYDTDKGGNPALMAPEIVLAEPGIFTSIDYSKSDSWATGAIAYEIFCGYNPFYKSSANWTPLRSTDYTENQLPELPPHISEVIGHVVAALLARNPSRRLSAEFAATICQLYLWAPSSWLKPSHSRPLPSSSEILQWLLCLSTKVLCTGGGVSGGRRRSAAEYQLIASFLGRAKLSSLRSAIAWIQRS